MFHSCPTSLEGWRELDPPRHQLVLASCPQVTCVGFQRSLWSHLLPLCPLPAVRPRAGHCWPPALAPSLQTGWRAAARSQGCWEKRPGPGTGSALQGVPLLREPASTCLCFSISVAGWAPQEAPEMTASRGGRKQVWAEEKPRSCRAWTAVVLELGGPRCPRPYSPMDGRWVRVRSGKWGPCPEGSSWLRQSCGARRTPGGWYNSFCERARGRQPWSATPCPAPSAWTPAPSL